MNNWTKVTDTLPPDNGKYVLALSHRGKYFVVRTYESGMGADFGKTKWMDNAGDYPLNAFTHWMELPQEPL